MTTAAITTARDVAHQRAHNVGQVIQPQRSGRQQDHAEHHEPKGEIRKDARWIDMSPGPLNRLDHARPLQHPRELDAAKRPALDAVLQRALAERDTPQR